MADYRHVSDKTLAEILRPSFDLRRKGPVDLGDHQLWPAGPIISNESAAVDNFRTDVYHEVYDRLLEEYNQGALVNLGIKQGPKYNPGKPWLDSPPQWQAQRMPGRQQREEEEELRSVLEQQDLDFSSVGNNTGSSSSQ